MFERRKYERYDFRKELIISASHPENHKHVEFYAKTVNISRGGQLLYTIADFKEKTPCKIRFRTNAGATLERKARILRKVQGERPDFLKETESLYALEYDQVMSEVEILDILGPADSSRASRP